MNKIKLTDKFQDFLIALMMALTLPTENSAEHGCIESIILYFSKLKTKPAHRDRVFKKEVQDLWFALENCAKNSGHEKTSLVFWNLQAELKQLKFSRGFYEVLGEEFPEDDMESIRPIQQLKSFYQQQSSF